VIRRRLEVKREVYYALNYLQLHYLRLLIFVKHSEDILLYSVSGLREDLFDYRIYRFKEFGKDNTRD